MATIEKILEGVIDKRIEKRKLELADKIIDFGKTNQNLKERQAENNLIIENLENKRLKIKQKQKRISEEKISLIVSILFALSIGYLLITKL